MSSTKRASLSDKPSPLDGLFGISEPEVEEAIEEVEPEPEKPPKIEKPKPRQTTIMLYDEQLDWLDQMCIDARKDGGKPIRKAIIIRSLIDLARASNVDLSGIQSEDEIVVRLKRAIAPSVII